YIIVVELTSVSLSFLIQFCFFFFQAEDGIRDRNVTGVQTCALPILRRASAYELGPLTADDTVNLLAATADGSGIHFGDAAARRAATASFGFPYLVQLIGALAWRVTKDQVKEEVTQETIDAVLKEAIDTFGSQVHRPALRHVTDLQREFLRSMARLGGEEQSISEIAG